MINSSEKILIKKIIIGVLIAAAFLAVTLTITRTMYPNNIAETSETSENAELKTRRYKANLQTTAEAVKKIIPTLSSWGLKWKLGESKMENDQAIVTAEVPVVIFTDDLEVKLEQVENEVIVNVRSASRIGKSDFGENARHIRQLFSRLDKKLGKK